MEIPVLGIFRTVGTQEGSKARKGKTGESTKLWLGGKPLNKRRSTRRTKSSSEVCEPTLPRKAAIEIYLPVPKTNTGRRGENPKASGRSVVKELGKMTP